MGNSDQQENSVAHSEQVLPNSLFVMASPGPVLFPTLIAPFVVWQPKAIETVEHALKRGRIMGIQLCKDESLPNEPKFSDLYETGIVVKILKRLKLPDGSIQILVQGLKRYKARSVFSEDPVLVAEPIYFDEVPPEKSVEHDAITKNVINYVKELSETHPFFTEEMRLALVNAPHSGVAADIVAFAIGLGKQDAQAFLDTVDIAERFQKLLVHLRREQDVATVQKKINDEVNTKLQTLQREFFLKEQLKLIKKELGLEEEGKEKSSRTFRERIVEAKMPKDVEKIANEELAKFETLNEASPEYNITRNYLETLVSLPWSIETQDNLSLDHARDVLDHDHYGLEKVKERILEFLAVKKLKTESTTENDGRGSIILLVGPPGVGKTSIGKSIAEAMNRKMYRFSLGGMRDEAEIKGHRRTYIGAMPGKFIQAAKRAGSKNSVMILDEVDKISQSYSGDPAAALLEVLDPEQNHAFMDHYLDIPFDLSSVLFICTANSTSTIPPALLDRMEVIELSGYTQEEKVQIAKKYVLPKALKTAGLKKEMLKIDSKAMRTLIRDYAREPGMRILQQQLERIARKAATKIVERRESRERLKFPLNVDSEHLTEWLGPIRYWNEVVDRIQQPGVTIGLAWTPNGGEILFIEAADLPGTGALKLTGKMGETMTESANIAWTLVKKRFCAENNVDASFFKERDFHIHIPAGAVPKDGPSAGITLATTFYSLLTGRSSKQRLAMTGELSLTGKVLPVGGIREKLLGAKRAGVDTVLIPAANQKDLAEVPMEILKTLKIHLVSNIEEVFKLALEKDTGKSRTGRPLNPKRPTAPSNTGLGLRQ